MQYTLSGPSRLETILKWSICVHAQLEHKWLTPEARQTSGVHHFSVSEDGGGCEECEEGSISVSRPGPFPFFLCVGGVRGQPKTSGSPVSYEALTDLRKPWESGFAGTDVSIWLKRYLNAKKTLSGYYVFCEASFYP